MAKLIFENTGEEVDLEDGHEIAESCEDAGVPFACTEGVCGTCLIQVTDGIENLSPYTEAEQDFLGEEMLDERLACQCTLKTGSVKITF